MKDSNIFESRKNEILFILKEALSKGLHPLFRVYYELLKKLDSEENRVLTISVTNLANKLNYSSDNIRSFVGDLADLNFINYRIDENDSDKIIIEILVI